MKKLKYILSLLFFILVVVFTILFQFVYISVMKYNLLLNVIKNCNNLIQPIMQNIDSGQLTQEYINEFGFCNNFNIVIFDSDNNVLIETMANPNTVFINKYKEDINSIEATNHNKDYNNVAIAIKATSKHKQDYIVVFERYFEDGLYFSNNIFMVVVMLLISACILFFVSYLVSIYISTPIEDLTKKATELSDTSKEIEFDFNDYYETNQLSHVLTLASKELVKIEKLRNEFIAGVSHDFRTPLTIISSNAQIIKELYLEDKTKITEKCNLIISESNRLQELVQTILNLSKFKTETEPLKLTPISFNEEMSYILKRYDHLKTEGYDIVVNLSEDVYINVDKPRIEQVIFNIINNAINYTRDSLTKNITSMIQDDYLLLEITDEGIGMSEEEQKYIFDLYYRSNKVKRDRVGTGLGLSIVKAILVQHNLDYGIKSIENVGTTFWIKFPIFQGKDKNNG